MTYKPALCAVNVTAAVCGCAVTDHSMAACVTCWQHVTSTVSSFCSAADAAVNGLPFRQCSCKSQTTRVSAAASQTGLQNKFRVIEYTEFKEFTLELDYSTCTGYLEEQYDIGLTLV